MAPILHVSRRIYAAVLLLYPVALRRQFGEEMIEVFADQMQDAFRRDGWIGAMGVWCCVARSSRREQWKIVPLVFDESDEPLVSGLQLNRE